ncbi:MAG TPA: PadR family transcriptional regulator [Gemmatimonadales bacterium]|jgi:DNA-binding PadR family transcriptional regulator|nr:PadR family transcriptional regulator [Gemmatimonadales bacterium]
MSRIGAFEELVLLAVLGLDGSGYGMTIRAELEAETGEAISLGAVYATLDRLERKGLVRSTVGPATAERGGRRKRVFRVSAAGSAALRAMQRIRSQLGAPAPART